jgi:hypothetical protein
MCYKRDVYNTFLNRAPILEQTELNIIFDNIITSNPVAQLSAAALQAPLEEAADVLQEA